MSCYRTLASHQAKTTRQFPDRHREPAPYQSTPARPTRQRRTRKGTHMRKSLATLAITAGLGLAIAGCSSSPTAPHGTAGSGSTPDAIAGSTSLTGSSTSQVNILLYNINSDGPYYRALLTGAIGDFGPAVAIYPNGKVDQEHNSEMELNLSRGTFRLNIAQLEREFFAHAMQHYPAYPATCSVFDSLTVPVPIVAGSGTGAYRGIAGTFTVTVTAEEDLHRPCNSPTRQWEVILLAGQGILLPVVIRAASRT